MSAPATVGTTTVAKQASGTEQAAPAVPVGTIAGDLLVLAVFIASKPAGLATPAGWTKRAAAENETGETVLFSRKYEGEAMPTLKWTAKAAALVTLTAVSGYNEAAPINVESAWTERATAAEINTPEVTTTVAECLMLLWACTTTSFGSFLVTDEITAGASGLVKVGPATETKITSVWSKEQAAAGKVKFTVKTENKQKHVLLLIAIAPVPAPAAPSAQRVRHRLRGHWPRLEGRLTNSRGRLG